MKTMFYLEIKDSKTISGSSYPLGKMTDKQAIKEATRILKNLRRENKDIGLIEANICTDEDCLDLTYGVSLFSTGNVVVWDYTLEKTIIDTGKDKFEKKMNRIHKLFDTMDRQIVEINNISPAL